MFRSGPVTNALVTLLALSMAKSVTVKLRPGQPDGQGCRCLHRPLECPVRGVTAPALPSPKSGLLSAYALERLSFPAQAENPCIHKRLRRNLRNTSDVRASGEMDTPPAREYDSSSWQPRRSGRPGLANSTGRALNFLQQTMGRRPCAQG